LFCLYIYRNGRRRRRTSSFLTAAGIALFPPTFSFLGPFFKNSHGDPKRKQQKKGGGPAGVGKKTRCAVLLPLFFLRVHTIPLYSTHTSLTSSQSNRSR
jgi:hypothetical protein